MGEDDFQAGDEIEWGAHRGRVVDFEGNLFVQRYDELGKLKPEREDIPPDARLISAVDALAGTLPELFHAAPLIDCTGDVRVEPEQVYCGAFEVKIDGNKFKKGAALIEGLPQDIDHRVVPENHGKEWSDLIRTTTWELDHENRSQPLDKRELPDEAYAKAASLKLCRDCFRAMVMRQSWPAEPGRLSQDDLRQFVVDYVDGQIYTDAHLTDPSMVGSVFMCLGLMPPPPPDYTENIGRIYARMKDAGPRAINGMPMFFGHSFMHKEDWDRVVPVLQAELERREALKNIEI